MISRSTSTVTRLLNSSSDLVTGIMASIESENTSQGDFYQERAKEFVELHDQVETSVNLLDSLESFLSTFQKDLDAVAGQISELQDRSKDIEGRLKSRRRIERPLSSLLSDITISPSLAAIILDTNVGEPWIEAIDQFEQRLITSRSRTRVKAARDLGEVAEGLRIVAATKLRGFFLALFQPIRSSVTTNMQVIQTSVLLKYSTLFAFLQRQAPAVANELQRAYVGAARLYYETGFRRYARSLGSIKTRTPEKFEPIVNMGEREAELNLQRLQHAKMDGPGVTLAFMADNKAHKEPIEALFRSLLLVFMDNATAEYTFITAFFATSQSSDTVESSLSLLTPNAVVPTPTMMATPDTVTFEQNRSPVASEYEGSSRHVSGAMPGIGSVLASTKEDQALVDSIWRQVMDPVTEYCQTFLKTVLEPMPAAVPLLTMIRLTEDIVTEVQKRRCPPAENFIFGIRIQMWPVFQKVMHEHIESLKKLAEGTSGGYFSRSSPVTDASVAKAARHYVNFFNSFVCLTEHEEETMIFSNLQRLREELAKLISRHTEKITDVVAKATAQSALYEIILQDLSKGTQHSAHLKLQKEIAHWAYLDEEAKRKIVSAGQSRPRHSDTPHT
ncbi:Sac2 family-domain-containing protein [Ephemerocybe angulata]|uniref:Sac2 family-domain-containing protein n=1 Tax=Ephemerocybe angulata TaxID=980116 RepID=A0A8H6ICM2_9AGAR|nr:Sac2 family-domain-containing protein [Tulosesus angulatus]